MRSSRDAAALKERSEALRERVESELEALERLCESVGPGELPDAVRRLASAIREREQVLAALSDLMERRRADDERARRLATEQQAREEAQAAERWFRFLAEASSVLAASLDYEATLRNVARLVVRVLADWCIVDVLDADNGVRRVATAHADPRKKALVRELTRFPPDPDKAAGVPHVLRTGQPALFPEVTVDMLREVARDEEHLRLNLELGSRSAMIVPLVARGRVLGAMTLVVGDSGRRYGPGDLPLVEELARRAALAVDNARLYRAALVANEAKSDFLAVMSHELRTPLNAIMGYTDLLDAGVVGELEPAQREQLGRIKTSAIHLLNLIEEILTFTRMEAGRAEVEPTDHDLRDVVREVAELVEPLARTRGLRFTVEVPRQPVPIHTDAGKLKQVLINLLSNAVKFTNEGEVALSAAVEGDRVVLVVRDTGIGIRREDRRRIFDPFWQVDQARTRRTGGTGLGLSVARRLAGLLGGEIQLESEPGAGSTFTVRLPLRMDGGTGGSPGN